MKKRIIISVTSDLVTDQRVLKVANSCYQNGFELLLVGRQLRNSLSLKLPFPYLRMRLLCNKSAFFYAEYNIRLFFLLLFSRFDILLSNDTDTLPANYFVSKIRKKKLLFDAHELFPEVPELTDRPRIKRIWESIEDRIFPKLKYSYTVCHSIADYYYNKYGISMKVIRNVPYYRFSKKSLLEEIYSNKKVIIYQGYLNIGRGLEWVIDAMPFIDNAVLIIIGCGDIEQDLRNKVQSMQLEDKVLFKGKMEPDKLHEYTPLADVGLCLLENKGLSYYFSLPNRIFDYIQAGVPVLATRFPEIENIVETYNSGVLIDHYEPEYLAATIKNMFDKTIDKEAFRAAAKELCWENEEKILLDLLNE